MTKAFSFAVLVVAAAGIVVSNCSKHTSPVEPESTRQGDLGKKGGNPKGQDPEIRVFSIGGHVLIQDGDPNTYRDPNGPVFDLSQGPYDVYYEVYHPDGIAEVSARIEFDGIDDANAEKEDWFLGQKGILIEEDHSNESGPTVTETIQWDGTVKPDPWDSDHQQPFKLIDQLASDTHDPNQLYEVQKDHYRIYFKVKSKANPETSTSEVCYIWIKAEQPPPPYETFHVTCVAVEALPDKGPNMKTRATVKVETSDPYNLGFPVGPAAGVKVLGFWSGIFSESCCSHNIGTTDETGVATIEGPSFNKNKESGDIIFWVADLEKQSDIDTERGVYNPWANRWDAEACPGPAPEQTWNWPSVEPYASIPTP